MIKIILLLLISSSVLIRAQIYSEKDVDNCKSKFNLAAEENLQVKPIGDVIAAIGKSFIGTEYIAHTLEKGKTEHLVVNLTGLDCTTFLETDLAFARCIKEKKTTFEDYQNELTKIRYRGGVIDQYPSRLHYFSDWIYDMNKRGIGKDITKEIGGVPYKKKIDFMSTHSSAYKQLKDNPKFVKEIEKVEDAINSRKYFYIPKEDIDKVEDKIHSGDIIGITTNIGGLDISHTGIAYRADDGRIHLLHAPNVGYKVQISEKPLAEYLMGNKKQTGIMLIRPL